MEKASFMRRLLCEKTLTQIVGSVVDKNSIEAAITIQCAYRHRVQKRQRICDKCGSVLTQKMVESIAHGLAQVMLKFWVPTTFRICIHALMCAIMSLTHLIRQL